jgi:hypothetical protein
MGLGKHVGLVDMLNLRQYYAGTSEHELALSCRRTKFVL